MNYTCDRCYLKRQDPKALCMSSTCVAMRSYLRKRENEMLATGMARLFPEKDEPVYLHEGDTLTLNHDAGGGKRVIRGTRSLA